MQEDQSKAVLSSAAIAALNRGNKIEAIKLVRGELGVDLKEAKDLVEAYLKANQSAQASFSAMQEQSGRKGIRWLVVIMAVAVLAYVLLKR